MDDIDHALAAANYADLQVLVGPFPATKQYRVLVFDGAVWRDKYIDASVVTSELIAATILELIVLCRPSYLKVVNGEVYCTAPRVADAAALPESWRDRPPLL
jgi:hypothetical protein